MTPDEQIDHILKLMLEREWKGGESHRVLAAAWGVHPRTVGDRAVAAAAVLRRIGGPIEDMVRAKLAELERQQHVAMELKKHVLVPLGKGCGSELQFYDAPDVKAANQAVQMYLDVLGAFNHVAKRQEVAPDEVAKMSREEKIAAHKQALAELESEGKEMH